MSSLAVQLLTCVHDSASLQFARILARVAVKKRLHQVSASRRDDARGRGRRKRKRPPGGGRSCTGCGEDYSAAASAAALAAADREGVGAGKRVSVRVTIGGRRDIKKKKKK